jgi:hypothetical protein
MGKFYHVGVKTKELTAEQILSVPCTTCRAAIGEVCELHTGTPRTEPHRDRKLSAADAVELEQKTGKLKTGKLKTGKLRLNLSVQ